MVEWMKGFFTNPANIDQIVIGVVIFLIGVISPKILKGVKNLFKWLINLCWRGIKRVVTKSKSKLEKIKEDRDYKRTIKQIERKKIPVTDKFLWKKSPEENPELRKIFQMIDDGEIEAPDSIKIRNILLSDEVFKQSPYYKSLKQPTPPDIKK